MADIYWAEREGARWDVYSKQRGWMAHADTEDDARLILAGLEALQAQQPAAAVPADVARHAAVAVTYLDCSGGMPAGLSLALQRLRDALAQQPAAAVPAENVAADAYAHACERMEEWQRKRAAEGKEIGTQGSLCDGIAWLYQRVEALEAQQPAAAVPEGWSGWAIQYPGKLPKLYGAEEIARLNWSPDAGADLVRVVEIDRVRASEWAAAERKGES